MNSGTPVSRREIAATPPLLLTAQGAAEALAVPEATIKNLHRKRELRGVKVGKHLRFSHATLLAFVEELDKKANGG